MYDSCQHDSMFGSSPTQVVACTLYVHCGRLNVKRTRCLCLEGVWCQTASLLVSFDCWSLDLICLNMRSQGGDRKTAQVLEDCCEAKAKLGSVPNQGWHHSHRHLLLELVHLSLNMSLPGSPCGLLGCLHRSGPYAYAVLSICTSLWLCFYIKVNTRVENMKKKSALCQR